MFIHEKGHCALDLTIHGPRTWDLTVQGAPSPDPAPSYLTVQDLSPGPHGPGPLDMGPNCTGGP